MNVLSFTLTGCQPAALAPAMAALVTHGAVSQSRDLTYGGYSASIKPIGISKWTGVLAFCAARGLDASHVLSHWDGENDVDLLRNAAISCAVKLMVAMLSSNWQIIRSDRHTKVAGARF